MKFTGVIDLLLGVFKCNVFFFHAINSIATQSSQLPKLILVNRHWKLRLLAPFYIFKHDWIVIPFRPAQYILVRVVACANLLCAFLLYDAQIPVQARLHILVIFPGRQPDNMSN
jgi:hypothetical protein